MSSEDDSDPVPSNAASSNHYVDPFDPMDVFVPVAFRPARVFEVSWSVQVGWVGVSLCFISAICVYILSKLMRSGLFLVI